MITNQKDNDDLAIFPDRKLLYEFANEKYFDEKALGIQSTRDESLIKLLQSPNVMVSASGVSISTRFSSSNPNQLGDRLQLLDRNEMGINSDIIFEEIFAIADK